MLYSHSVIRQWDAECCFCQLLQIVGQKMNPFIPLTSLIVFIFFYFVMSQYFSHRKFNYLQETSIAILIGAVVGLFVFLFTDFFQSGTDSQQFVKDIIFLILLPPIMFEDGYNFPKRKFFQNILYVNLYGVLGTILNFLCIWTALYLFNEAGLITSVSDSNEVISLYNWQILLIAASLSSIEPIVTEKVVDKERYPKLFSIIFGESLYKDTIAITLFDSIKDMVVNNSVDFDIEGSDIGFLILRFLEVVIGSILIGIIISLITTVIFKNLRFLVEEKGISEVALTILTGYLAYVISQWLSFSGVISMLFCGTVLSHYNIYNLTDEGKEATMITIEVLKIVASGLIFFFIGFEVFSVKSFQSSIDDTYKSSFSLVLLGATFLGLLIGRIFNIYVVSLLGYLLVKKEKWRVNVYEYFIIFMAGLIHGAVPFALSVTIPYTTYPSSNCSQLNIVSVILITSLVFNGFIPKVQKIMLGKVRELRKTDPYHPSLKDSFIQSNTPSKISKLKKSALIADNPNAPLLNKVKSTTQKYWRKFEEGLLKPHLIFDYYQRKGQIKMQKIKRRQEQHQKYMARYGVFQKENILNAENEQDNRFVDVKLSNTSSSQEESEQGIFKIRVSNPADLKKQQEKRRKTGCQQEIVTITRKGDSSDEKKKKEPVKAESKGEIVIKIEQSDS